MSYELDDATRPTTRRVKVEKIDDKGTQQFADLTGYKDETPKRIWHTQPFGFSTNPPAGSDGIIDQMGSRSDRTFYRDAGHEKYRPKRTPEGGSNVFDNAGNILRIYPEHADLVHKKKLTLRIGKGYKIDTESDDGGYDQGEGEGEGGEEGEDDESGEDEKLIHLQFSEEDGTIELEYDGNQVKIDGEGGHIEAKAKTSFAGGVDGGKWVVAKSGRVDLGVSSPSGTAPNKVATEAGLSSIVFAVI